MTTLETVQFAWGGLFDAEPVDDLIHLVRCGGVESIADVVRVNEREPWDRAQYHRACTLWTLCGLDLFAPDGPGFSRGGGVTKHGATYRPCPDCVTVRGEQHSDAPVRGSTFGRLFAAEQEPAVQQAMTTCRSDYYTDTGRQQGHNDRGVRCGLQAGHAGDHDELIDGTIDVVTWPRRTVAISVTITRTFHADRAPRIVVLCGSTRFVEQYRAANLAETLAGRIVLSIGCDTRSDADLAAAGQFGHDDLDATKQQLDELHRRKIDLADEVLVVSDASGYHGDSTRGEIEYAQRLGKPVRYLVGEGKDDANG